MPTNFFLMGNKCWWDYEEIAGEKVKWCNQYGK